MYTAKLFYPLPRTYSYNFACDVVDKLYNPNYKPLCDDSPITVKHINSDVTYYYLNGEQIAIYEERSGLLWIDKEVC